MNNDTPPDDHRTIQLPLGLIDSLYGFHNDHSSCLYKDRRIIYTLQLLAWLSHLSMITNAANRFGWHENDQP